MRVLLVSTYSPVAVGGVGQFVHDFSIELHRRGIEVSALYRYETPEFSVSPQLEEAARLVAIRPFDLQGLRTISTNLGVASWIRKHRDWFDVIHTLTSLPFAAAALRAGHRLGAPVVATIFAKYPRSTNPLLEWMNQRAQRALLRRADVLVYESTNTMREFHPYTGRVILNGIDTAYFRPRPDLRARMRIRLSIAPSRFVVLFLGRMDRLKGIYLFLEALSILRRNVREFTVLLVGSIDVVDLPQRIGALDLSEHVRVVGPVGKLDVLDYYSAADVFVLPSYLEGISSSLIEAMACGVPPVATRVGGNPEVVRNGVEGLLVPSGDPWALAEALGRLYDSPGELRGLAQNARLRVENTFSLTAMADKYLESYREVAPPTGSD